MLSRFLLGVAVVAAALAANSGQAQVSVAQRLAEDRAALIAPHRSVRLGGFPENSLAGMEYAIDRGIDIIHINPQLTGDDRYVLMHDSTLNRTTDVETVFPDGPPDGPTRAARGGKDYVRDYALADIRRLRLTDGGDGGGHPVPTLEDALDLIDGRTLVRLGLKTYEVDSLAKLLNSRETDNILLFGVLYNDPNVLSEISAATGIAAAISMTGSRDPRTDLDRLAKGIGPALRLVLVETRQLTPDFVARADALGIRYGISGWRGREDSALEFKNDPSLWRAAFETGAAAFMTRHPEALLDLLGR